VNVKRWLVTASILFALILFARGDTNVSGPYYLSIQKRTGTTIMSPQYFASHITTKTTTTPVASTCYVSAIAISVTGAGSAQTLVIQNKEATPKVLYTAGAAIAVGNTYINFAEPMLMTSGVDIVTAGTTAGTQDVFVTCWQ
jgi:hypothetical protein